MRRKLMCFGEGWFKQDYPQPGARESGVEHGLNSEVEKSILTEKD